MSSAAYPKSRLGYKSQVLRWVSSVGLTVTGAVGSIAAIADLTSASIIAPVAKVVISNPDHLRYTYAIPEYPFAAAVMDSALAALSAVVGGVGLARVLKDSEERQMAISIPPIAAVGISLFLALGTALGSTGMRVGAEEDRAWTKAYFSNSRVLPSYGLETKADGSEKYYANSVTLTDKDGAKEYFMITPVANEDGKIYGIDTKEVTQAAAQKTKAHYNAEQAYSD